MLLGSFGEQYDVAENHWCRQWHDIFQTKSFCFVQRSFSCDCVLIQDSEETIPVSTKLAFHSRHYLIKACNTMTCISQ